MSVQAVVPLRDGKLALRVGAGRAHVILDLVGHHTGLGNYTAEFSPGLPVRAIDTRTGDPLVGGRPRTLNPFIGSTQLAVVVNATVTGASAPGHLTLAAGPGSVPTVVSYQAGVATASYAVVEIGNDGTFQQNPAITATIGGGTAHLVLDVLGTVPRGSTVDLPRKADTYLSGPTRLLDTRSGPPVAAGTDRKVQVRRVAGVPADASAVLLTVTATRGTEATHLSAYRTGEWPGVSTLNYQRNQTVANTALVPLAADGSISLRVGGGTAHVLLDVAGYLQR